MMIDNDASNKIKANKYKILRMSLLLGQEEDRQETISNFEDAARDIDKMNDEIYVKEVEKKFFDTLTLEEEETKLAALVDYIGGRVGQRNSLLSDFFNITGYELTGLSDIKYADRLNEYKDRLNYIREYLNNTNEIKELNDELSKLESKLEVSYSNKEKAESLNEKNESELLNKFKNILSKVDEFKNIDVNKIDILLSEISSQVADSKKSLDIFKKSFNTLEVSGISKEEEQEYYSYVESAKENYYKYKESEYILSIYKLLSTNEIEYNKLVDKRDAINDLLEERLELRKELSIKDKDIMFDIYELLDNQYKIIEEEKKDLDDINHLTNEISSKRDKIKELELDNQKVEILSLLKEFCIIDTYEEVAENADDEELSEYYVDSSESDNLEKEENENLLNGEINLGVNDTDLQSINNEVDANVFNNDQPDELNLNETINNSSDAFEDNDNNVVKNENITDEDLFNQNSNKEKDVEEVSSNINDLNNDNEINIDVSVQPEEVKDNQVVSVNDIKDIDIKSIVEKANTVMKRVGKMLGVEVEPVATVSNVDTSNESISDNNSDIEQLDVTKNDVNAKDDLPVDFGDASNNNADVSSQEEENPFTNLNVSSVSEEETDDKVIDVDKENIFFGSENSNVNGNDTSSNETNPFISDSKDSDADANDNNFSLEKNPFGNATFDDNLLGDNNFWDNAYDDGGLNTLPDLPVNGEVSSDNFFANNEFPDLNEAISNNSEVQ